MGDSRLWVVPQVQGPLQPVQCPLSSAPLEQPLYLASPDKLLTPNFFLLTIFSPEEMSMGLEASEAISRMKEAFLNCSVFFS